MTTRHTLSVLVEDKPGVLARVAALFSRRGFHQTSLADIASAAGVSLAEVGAQHPSKEGLFYEVVSGEVDAFVATAARWIDPRLPAGEMLRRLSEKSFSHLDSRPLLLHLVRGLLAEFIPGQAEPFQRLRTRCAQVIVDALAVGVAQGVFRPDVKLEVAAVVLLDLHVTAFLYQPTGPDRLYRIQQRRIVAIDLVLRGLCRPSA